MFRSSQHGWEIETYKKKLINYNYNNYIQIKREKKSSSGVPSAG